MTLHKQKKITQYQNGIELFFYYYFLNIRKKMRE